MDLSPKKPKQYICRDWVRNLGFCELGDRPLDLVDKKKRQTKFTREKFPQILSEEIDSLLRGKFKPLNEMLENQTETQL